MKAEKERKKQQNSERKIKFYDANESKKRKKCWARGAQKPSRNLWSEILGKAHYMRLMFSTATCAERYFFGGRVYWIFQFTFPSEFIAINLEMRGSIRRQQPDQSSRNKFFAM